MRYVTLKKRHVEKTTDAGGRFALAVLESDVIKVIVANVYD